MADSLTKLDSPSFLSSRYLAVNASITTVSRGLGLASGIVLDALIVAVFGLSGETDAYFAAFAIPSLITSTIEAQAPKVLVPFFAQSFETDGRAATWGQMRSLIATSGLLLLALAAALTLAAGFLVPVQVPGLRPDTVRLAVSLHMLLAWSVFTQGLATVLSGALYADHHYLATTSSRLLTNVVSIVVTAVGYRQLGIYALALGLLVGSCVQLGCLLCVAASRGLRWGRASVRDPRVTRLLALSIYPLFGQALSSTTVFLENFFGSMLGAGALSLVRYANRIAAALAGVLIGGLVTTSLPMLSHYAARHQFEDMKEALLRTLRFVALLAVPIALLLVFAGGPMVAAAFERGRFTSADTHRLGLLLAMLAPYILFGRVAGVVEVAFYATHEMRKPLWAIAVFLVCYVVLCWLLLGSLGVFAFAVAASLGAIVTAVLMVRLVEARFGPLPWANSKTFGRRLAVVAGASVVGFLAGSAANLFIIDSGQAAKIVRLLVATAPGMFIFVSSSFLVRLVNWRHLLHVPATQQTATVADSPTY